MASPPPLGAPGTLFHDRYELRAELGSGHFGEVWEAFDTHRGHVVALKLLYAGKTSPDAAWQEATRLTELESPYILRVNNAALAIDVPYLDTALAVNGTAAATAAPLGVVSHRAVAWTRHVAQGLALCHQRRLLHRDIKPDNVFLDSQNDAKLGDFGVAALMDANDTAAPHGDPEIRAPEVLRGGRCTAASDIWSLGLTLYGFLTGSLPHRWGDHGDFNSLRSAILGGIPDIRDEAPHVELALAKVVRRALEAVPSDRYTSAAEMALALARVKRGARDVARVTPHAGAERCWDATPVRAGGPVHVCVEPRGAGHVAVEVRYVGSNNRFRPLCREVKRSGSAKWLRKVFKVVRLGGRA